MKQCPSCNEFKPLTNEFFPRNSTRKSGFNSLCKVCHCEKAKSDRERFLRKARDAARYRRAKNKELARKDTREKFGCATDYACSVLNCEKRAEHFHHINYDRPLDVVPLCKEHHELEHYKDISA